MVFRKEFMKQHIAVDQLNELSQKQRLALRKYMLKDWARPMVNKKGESIHAEIPTEDYLLSIGQMIEFLVEKTNHKFDDILYEGTNWAVYYGYGSTKRIELCDALWEAVKKVLNGKN